jgi:alpha-glucosidase
MTQEGVRGNEHMPTAGHNTTLPFTRFLAGPADYTVCYYTPRLKTTRAHQLALPVVYFSPWQFLFWYDKPSDAGDEPELEFFRAVPTTWDETRVLDDRIGEHVTIARRRGEEWFVGTITNEAPRTAEIPLAFLGANRKYEASTYCDGETPRQVAIERVVVTAKDRLSRQLAASGGCAVWLRPR